MAIQNHLKFTYCNSDTTAEHVCQASRSAFAAWGLQEELISENVPTLSSAAFVQSLGTDSTQHTFSAIYHPQSNGETDKSSDTNTSIGGP
jgi:hypothetical protein